MARHSKQSVRSDEARVLRTMTIDQAISGASNLLIALLAVRVLDPSGYGLWSILFLVYQILIGVSRALVGDPMLVHPKEALTRPGDPIGACIVLGLSMGALTFGSGVLAVVWSHSLGFALMALGICLGPLLLQDLGRYLGFATKRPRRAVTLDSLWLGAVIVGVAGLLATHTESLFWFVVVWGGTGGASALLTLAQNRGAHIRLGVAWIRFTWPFSWRYLISYSASQGAGLVASAVVGAVTSTAELGAVSGAVLLVRPYGTIQLAAVAAGTGEIARSGYTPPEAFRRGVKISTRITVIAVINTAILLALPTKLGVLILHTTWHLTKPLLLPNGVQIIGLGIITGARAGLLGLRAAHRTVKLDVVNTVLVLLGTVVGVVLGGVRGALWAVALVQSVMAVLWWVVFRYHLAHPTTVTSTVEEVERAERLPVASYPPNQAQGPLPIPLLLPPLEVGLHEGVPVREVTPWAPWR